MEHPWLKSYPPGVPHRIGTLDHHNLIEFFDFYHHQHSGHIAFENMGAKLTYDQVDSYSTHFGAYLQKLGLKPGDRIAIQLPNILQFPIAFIGAIKAGLIIVPTNPLYTPREMEHQFKDSGAKAIVILSNFACNLEKIIENTSLQHVIITRAGDLMGTMKGTVINFVIKYIKKLEPDYQIKETISFKNALKEGQKCNLSKISFKPEDLALLQYTGGTTGLSKGVQLSHFNILSHTEIIRNAFNAAFTGNNKDITITSLPLYHILSLALNLICCYVWGAKNILITNPRDIPGFIKELKKHKFTFITGVNTLYNALLNHPEFATVDFSKLKLASSGAMALQDSVAKKWKEVTGQPIIQGYGLSENSGALSANPYNGLNRSDTIGIPLPSTELGIFDESGNPLPPGEVGEICARGPQVMKGYWNYDNTGVFFNDNWLKTGDMGVMDTDGYFKIVDRKKDMINVSGLKVFPNEIEEVISSHPKVFESAVIGIPDEQCGEAVKLFVVKKDMTLTEQELKEFCIANFVKYKIPKYFVFTDSIPKTPVGKILRRELRNK